jgi:hypothetical protein
MIFIKYENKNKYLFLNINIFNKIGLIYYIKLKENLEKMENNNNLYPNKLLINHNLILIQEYKYHIIISIILIKQIQIYMHIRIHI